MTNVKLSKEEFDLVSDAGFILTKNRIIQKVYNLFGNLCDEYKQVSDDFPAEVLAVHPKISKGENYLGLPWVMLDYPRSFSNTNVFAIRSFFWWGNFFSITLQLQGSYKEKYGQQIQSFLASTSDEWWIGVAEDPWQHHFGKDNYIPSSAGIKIEEMPFIKLAKKIPLQQWDNSFDFFAGTFKQFTGILSTQAMK